MNTNYKYHDIITYIPALLDVPYKNIELSNLKVSYIEFMNNKNFDIKELKHLYKNTIIKISDRNYTLNNENSNEIIGYCPYDKYNKIYDVKPFNFYIKICSNNNVKENIKKFMEQFGLFSVHTCLLNSIILLNENEVKLELFKKWHKQFSKIIIEPDHHNYKYYLDMNNMYFNTTPRLDWLQILQKVCRFMMKIAYDNITGDIQDKLISIRNGINIYKFKPSMKTTNEPWTHVEYENLGFQYVYIRNVIIQRFFESIDMYESLTKILDMNNYENILSFGEVLGLN